MIEQLDFSFLTNSTVLPKLIASVALFVLVLLVRRLLLNKISRRENEDRRHLMNTVKQLSNGVLFIALIVIWASEVQNLAISVAAFVVAIVLATREFLQCLLGFFYYLITRPFKVGDWIEINDDTSGEVYSIDWMKVTLLEVCPSNREYTGKTSYLPNNWLVIRKLRNLNFMRRYLIHSFTLTLANADNIFDKSEKIRQILMRHCCEFREVALRYKDKIERHLDTEFIEVDPDFTVSTNQYGLLEIHIALFCPTAEAHQLQREITMELLKELEYPLRNGLGVIHAQPLAYTGT